jgi:hypothetical protein
MAVATHTWISEVAERSRDFDKKAEDAFRPLSPEQLNWRPDKDTWSVGQQLHHMVLANTPYVKIVEDLAASAGPARDEYKAGFWGRFLIKAVGPEESVPAPVPKPMIPTEAPLDKAILEEFLSLQVRYHKALAGVESKDLNGKFTSPFAKMIKLKLGDAIKIIERHNERHIGKALKLLERPEFPK